jgi:hypothetical protein
LGHEDASALNSWFTLSSVTIRRLALATRITQDQMERLARLGAVARIEELRRELEAITRAFPDLAGPRAVSPNGGRRASAAAASEGAATRRRRRMSSAARRAVSERMKRYWAERRKEKGARRS